MPIFYHRRESENLLIYSEEFKIVILSFKKWNHPIGYVMELLKSLITLNLEEGIRLGYDYRTPLSILMFRQFLTIYTFTIVKMVLI